VTTRTSQPSRTAGEPAPAEVPWPVWRLAWVIVFGAFVAGLDASLTNIGLVSIGADLKASLDTVQWVSSGYLVAFAVSLPICGWLGRRVGVGRLWLCALAVFTAASGLCAVAWNVESLIALRVVQGLAGGMLIPAGQTVLGQAVGSSRLGRVMATLGVAVTVAPAIGPFVGGVLLHSLPWPWLFLINIPIGVVGLALGIRYVPRGRPGAAAPLDLAGFVLSGSGLPLLVYGLTEWGATGAFASTGVALPVALGAAALAAFGLRTWGRADPLMDLGLYRNPVYAAASVAAAAAGALMFGSALLFPLYFQILHHASVVETGLRLLSLGFGTAVTVIMAGRLTDRYGGGVVSLVGAALTLAATLPFLVIGANADPVVVQVLLTVFGMAIALAAVPPGIAAYKTVDTDRLPDATTQVNIVMRVGGALGGAVLAVVLAAGLADGAEQAFQTTFWWLTGTSALALLGSWSLWRTLRAAQP